MTRDELISDLRERINPAYADQRGTESYERKLLAQPFRSEREKEAERKLAKLEAENAAQLTELHAISAAIGTAEGHSSVQHIEALHEKLAVARNAMTKAATLECNGVIRAALAQIGGDDAGS